MNAYHAHGQFDADGSLTDIHFNLTPERLARRKARGLDLRLITIVEGDLSDALLELIAEAQATQPGWPRAKP